MFLFVWVNCLWPADPNVGGIWWKAVILGHKVRP